ncbi:MAG: hypothetical protein V4496_02480 [Pseudomonadota bacterium]
MSNEVSDLFNDDKWKLATQRRYTNTLDFIYRNNEPVPETIRSIEFYAESNESFTIYIESYEANQHAGAKRFYDDLKENDLLFFPEVNNVSEVDCVTTKKIGCNVPLLIKFLNIARTHESIDDLTFASMLDRIGQPAEFKNIIVEKILMVKAADENFNAMAVKIKAYERAGHYGLSILISFHLLLKSELDKKFDRGFDINLNLQLLTLYGSMQLVYRSGNSSLRSQTTKAAQCHMHTLLIERFKNHAVDFNFIADEVANYEKENCHEFTWRTANEMHKLLGQDCENAEHLIDLFGRITLSNRHFQEAQQAIFALLLGLSISKINDEEKCYNIALRIFDYALKTGDNQMIQRATEVLSGNYSPSKSFEAALVAQPDDVSINVSANALKEILTRIRRLEMQEKNSSAESNRINGVRLD